MMRMMRRTLLAATLVGLGLALAWPAAAQDQQSEIDCYDAIVKARIVDQVPSVIPEFDDGSIVMRWPWFVDLDVEAVVKGAVSARRLSVLAVMHTKLITKRHFRWLLRANDTGGYNAVPIFEAKNLPRCEAAAAPALSYLRPTDGKTLADLRRDGEKRYKSYR